MRRPGRYDLDLYRGDSYRWEFRLWDDAEATSPTDLSSAVVAAEIRLRSGGPTAVTLTCAVLLPNIVEMTFEPAFWANLLQPRGRWDMQVTFPGDVVRTVLVGCVTVTADITDSLVVG